MKRRTLSLKIGQWVDAGFYTTGEVIQIHPLDENLVTVRFGSEIQNLNQRHTPLKPSQKEEGRSLRSVFRRGQWITHNTFGKGTVLIVNDVTLVIRFDYGIKKIASKRWPYAYVTPLQIPDTDIESPAERRRTFFDTHPEHKSGLRTMFFDQLMIETEEIRIDELWRKIRVAWQSRLS